MRGRIGIASHRGGAFLWPENSLAAFRASAGLALDQAECDVHLSADGEVVVIHDATLERTTDGRGPVVARAAAELGALRQRGAAAEPVPMLGEVLAVLRGTPVAPRVEIKPDAAGRPYPGIVPRVLAALDAAGERRRAWIIGFEAPTMAEAQAAGGLAGVAWLIEQKFWRAIGARGAAAAARAHGFPEIGVAAEALDAEAVAVLRAEGLGIGVWGANHAESIRRMIGLGVDILATDDPPLAIALRDEAEGRKG
ncbi:MAG TPA: glycerophosphodiester phosphodiesterase family protein [Acetobacteraceae bacterium]|nr:glycerophosphodiester phosphodiesterase family protein [Acetobacteraceae bacterium]